MKARQQEAKAPRKHHEPHCEKCGSTKIMFLYNDSLDGTEVDEARALDMACGYLTAEMNEDTEMDPGQLAEMAGVLHALAWMWHVRTSPEPEEGVRS